MKLELLILTCILSIGNLSEDDQLNKMNTANISLEQTMAFEVLKNRCNYCHVTQNPSKVFTLENMNDFTKRINRQVFVWKRMPKGKDNNLDATEKEILSTWIEEQLNK